VSVANVVEGPQSTGQQSRPVTFDRITAIYYNPNIAPRDEYERRRDAFVTYATERAIDYVVLDYDPATWTAATLDDLSFGARCKQCYALRLGVVADWARAHGADALTTTLTISPWQNHEAIATAGAAVAGSGVTYLPFDLRPLYREGQQAARDLGIYRQNYCGCAYSQQEAEEQRAARKAKKSTHEN
jgi:predicted adenine nucleotide alpha hydrolase (AANH) superfamily ATPase